MKALITLYRWVLPCLMLFATPSSVVALNLVEAYQAALSNDPTYQAAIHDHDASMESVPMARAGLLPQLAFTGAYSMNVGEQTVPARTQSVVQTITQGGRSVRQTISTDSPASINSVDYKASQYGISMRWGILNLEAIARFRQANSLEAYGEAKFNAAYNDLVVRVATAYFDTLLADDTRGLALAQVDALDLQLQSAQKRWHAGEGTRTDIAETEARLATAQAELIGAEDQIALTHTSLRQITGVEVTALNPLRVDFTAQAIEPSRLETWQAWSRELSPVLLMQRYAVESARRDVDRNTAGHWPKLDVVGSMNNSSSDSPFFANTTNQINSIGVQVNVPVFSGGYISAATTQAEATLRRTLSELDAKTNAVMLDTQKYLRAVLSGIEQISAHQKAVKAQKIAVKGTEAGLRLGTRIQMEVLDAQRLLFQAKRNLAQARYQYLLGQLRLAGSTRLLTEEDIQLVNSALTP